MRKVHRTWRRLHLGSSQQKKKKFVLLRLLVLPQVPVFDTQHSDISMNSRPFILDQTCNKSLKKLLNYTRHPCRTLDTSTWVWPSPSNIGTNVRNTSKTVLLMELTSQKVSKTVIYTLSPLKLPGLIHSKSYLHVIAT